MPEPRLPTLSDRLGTWEQLRRRKVVQWSLGYLAAAWALLQGVEFAVATFDWPTWFTRAAAIVAMFGLAGVVTLAWFHGDRGQQRVSRIEVLLLVGLVAAAGLTVWRFAQVDPHASGHVQSSDARDDGATRLAGRQRLAVLPFENLGNDPANRAFAGGVHESLITQVAKIPGLAVISRSSVMQFEGRRPTIEEVARLLNVGTVLEGSVQRDGSRLRIQAQLIDARTDAHLWAETYDRDSHDLFAVETEIAQAIAAQMRIHLTDSQSAHLAQILTSQPKAYEKYVLGRHYVDRREWEQAIGELNGAITLDNRFAAAHAMLSLARTWLAFDEPARRDELLPLALEGAQRALTLDPTLPEGHLARAVYYYRGEPDIERAAQDFEVAIAGLPNDAIALLTFGYLRRWQGRLDDAAALFARAAELDPGGFASESLVQALLTLGRSGAALEAVAEARRAQPDAPIFAVWPAMIAVNQSCDLATAERVLRELPSDLAGRPEVLGERWFFAVQVGDGAAAVAAADAWRRMTSSNDGSADWRMGIALLTAGRTAEGRAHLRAAAEQATARAQAAKTREDAASSWVWVAVQRGVLQDASGVDRALRKAAAALPESGASETRREVMTLQAIAYAQVGDRDRAIEQMEAVMRMPSDVKAAGFWCDPLLAPLRKDPRFRAQMAAAGANVAIDPMDRTTWSPPGS